jgi:hypothetical protein
LAVALLFIDGVGIGRPDPAVNPLASAHHLLSQFDDGTGESLPGGFVFSVDATFDVPGRPQSASNQTALLTGEPAPALIGRHVLGFPNAPLRALLQQRSIVKRMVSDGRSATFANCYPAAYLEALHLRRLPSSSGDGTILPRRGRRLRASATTLAMAAADVPLRTLEEARQGEGLTHDIDGSLANERGFEVPRRTPEAAAAIFWRLASKADFALFEHYLADEAGHAQDWAKARRVLDTFDRFCRAVVAARPPDWHLLICSDHGNVEDLSSRSHTLNQVPLLYFGPGERWAEPPQNLAEVGQTILRLVGIPG